MAFYSAQLKKKHRDNLTFTCLVWTVYDHPCIYWHYCI